MEIHFSGSLFRSAIFKHVINNGDLIIGNVISSVDASARNWITPAHYFFDNVYRPICMLQDMQ